MEDVSTYPLWRIPVLSSHICPSCKSLCRGGWRLNYESCRGHNFAVWDVAVSPLGHYFASASADRTARIWITERAAPLRVLAGMHICDFLLSCERLAARLMSQCTAH